MNKETNMMLRLAQGLAARGLGRAVWVMVLLLVGLAAQPVQAAGSYYPTSGIDIKQFSPSKELNKYWMYLDSTLHSGTGWSSATSGLIGIGANAYAEASTVTFKIPTDIGGDLSGGANVYFDTIVHIEGNSSFGNGSGIGVKGGIAQFDKDIYFANNGGTNNSATWVGGNLTSGGNPTYNKDLHINGKVFNSANYKGNVYFSGSAGSVGDTAYIKPASLRNFNQTYSAPLGPMTKFVASQLPAYNIPDLSTATAQAKGTLIDLYNANFNSSICSQISGGCVDVPAHTINGISLNAGKILPPGYYRNLTIDNMTFYLGEGVYYFNKVNLNNSGAKLIAMQPKGGRTIVYADSGFSTNSGGIFVGPDSAVGATKYGSGPGLFMGGTMMIAGGPGAEIYFDSDIKIWATLSTPTGRIYVNSGLTLFGQMFARHFGGRNTFTGGNGEFVPFDPDIPEIKIAISPAGTTVPEDDKVYTANISLSHKNAYAVSFKYATAISVTTAAGTVVGTAVPDVNFVSSPDAVVVIPAGDTLVTIPFTIKWDKVFTGNTTFYLNFTEPAGGKFGMGTGVVGDSSHVAALITILDKDRAPALRISDTALYEGNSGTTAFKFVVSFADSATGGPYLGTVGKDISFPWQTFPITASAGAGDYIGVTMGTTYGTIRKGKITDTLVVRVNGDVKYEPNEAFKVLIPVDSMVGKIALGAAGNKLEGIGTILNDDSLPQLKIDSIGFNEGDADSVRKLVVYLVDPVTGAKLDAASAPQVPVKYSWSTADGAAGHSLTGSVKDTDYVQVLSTRDSIPAGKWTDTLLVTTKGDEKLEANETFQVTLVPLDSAWKKAGNAVALDTIRNDDALPIVKITADSAGLVHEGVRGTHHPVTFTVGLYDPKNPTKLLTTANAPAMPVLFDWSTVNATAVGKASGSSDTDFVTVTGRRDSVKAGSVSTILYDTIIGDNRYEGNEYFSVALTNLVNASTKVKNDTVANLTIQDDDSLPRLKVVADNGGKVAEGAAGVHTKATFTVTLTDANGVDLLPVDAPQKDVSFAWKTVSDSAKSSGSGVADTDFVAMTNVSVTIPAGTLSAVLTDTIKGDNIDEANEWFHVTLTTGGAGTNASPNGILSAYDTIVDDDAAPFLTFTGTYDLEGDLNSKPFYTRFVLSSISALPVSFNWYTKSGSATSGGVDYDAVASKSLTIPAGKLKDSAAVTVYGDKKLESDETFRVAVDSASIVNAIFKTKETAHKIINDDARPKLTIRVDSSVHEGNSGTTAMTFTVSLLDSTTGLPLTAADAPTMPVTFTWQTADSSAKVSDNDYVAVPPTLDSVKAGQVSAKLTVQVKGDTRYELDDVLKVLLSGADYATFKDSVGVGAILNDDALPTLSIDSVSVTEPLDASSPDSSLTFTVKLSAAAGVPVSVKATTNDSTATGDGASVKYDYVPQTNMVLAFAPDVTSQTFTVKVHGDLLFEGTTSEVLKVLLTGATNATVKTSTGLGFIKDQDPPPSIKVDTVTVDEGASATFTVSLSAASALPVTFKWATAPGTATSGTDYTAVPATTVTIPAGSLSTTVSVAALKDSVANEGVETFFVQLTDLGNATLSGNGQGNIVDRTVKPAVSINDTVVNEDAGTMSFHVTLDKPSATALSLKWGTTPDLDVPAVKRAIVNTHYSSVSNKALVIRAGVTDTVIKVAILNAPQDDEDSLYFKTLLAKASATDTMLTFKDSVGVGIIRDLDLPPTISISNNVSKQEPADSGAKAALKISISLSNVSGRTVTVQWSTRDSTAKHDSDFAAVTSRTLTFSPGVQSIDDSVTIFGDNLFEGYEYFKVFLSNPFHATLKDSVGKATITDNDPAPSLSVGDVDAREPSIDSANATVVQTGVVKVPVRLDRPSAKTVVFNWTTIDSTAFGGANAASGKDFVIASGVDSIPAGDTLVYLPVTLLSDNISEPTEHFKLMVSDLNGLAVGLDTVGVVAIKDANGDPSLRVDSLTAYEADSVVIFHVKLSNPSAKVITVGFATVGLSATEGADYVGTSGTLTIPAFTTAATIQVTLKEDLLDENAETFRLLLTSGTNVNLVDSIGLGTILDDDSAPAISVRDSAILEPSDSGAVVKLVQTFTLSAPSGLDISAQWEARDLPAGTGHAKVGDDYVTAGGSVHFAPGATVYRDTVRVLGDNVYEGPETFEVLLSAPTHATLADSLAVDTILDADSAPALHIDSSTVREGDTARFTVRLEAESGLPVSFLWHTVAGTATAGKDYRDTVGTLVTIPAGSMTATLRVVTLADSLSGEGTEAYQVRLNTLTGARGPDTTGLGLILDTNSLPALSIDSVLGIHEADTVVHFTVTMAGKSAVDVHVSYKTVEGTAAAGVRYADTTGVLVIPAGQTSGKIAVRILDDAIREPKPETFTVVLGPVDSALLVQPIGLGEVIDDGDQTPLDFTSPDTVLEGEDAVFAVKVLGQTKDTVRVVWRTVAAGAKSDTDFVSRSGTIVFLPGQTQGSIVIPTLKDSLWEPVENFFVRIDSIAKGSFLDMADTLIQAWISDANGAPSMTFLSPDTTVQEDVSDSVPVRVGLSWAASVDLKVVVPRQAGTASIGQDYTVSGLVSDTLLFKAGSTVATFKVHVVKDSTDEYDETAAWDLQPIAPVKLGAKSRYELTIQDDDSAPLVRLVRDTQSVTEGGSTVVAFKLSRKSAKEITAWYVTTGTATPGVDDDRVEGLRAAILFPAGTDSASTTLTTLEDNIHEPTETAVFVLDGAVNAGLDSLHRIDTVRIVDNDDVPTVRFTRTDTTVLENVGTVTFTLTLSNPSAFETHVSICAKAGSATLDSTARVSDAVLDTLAAYPVTFAAGDTVATFSLRILDDGRVEPTENFFLKLLSTEAIPGDSAQVRILDNDVLPVVKITDPTEGERLGKKDLTASGKVPVSWTLNTAVQTPFDTLLPEGPSTIRKCYTDEWGNTGCDSVHVVLDLTAPTVKIDSISKDGGKTWLPVDPTVPWVNVPGILVAWHYDDAGTRVSKIDSANLIDTLTKPIRCVEDAVGNKGCDTATIGFDNVPPTVVILTPPSQSHWSTGNIGTIWTEQDGTVITRHDDVVNPTRVGPYVITKCSKPDRAGNVGCASDTIYVDPNVPAGATYVDTDGDGRIDAVIVQFPRNWTDPLPTFDISYAAPGANVLKGQTATYGTSSQSGTSMVYGGETIRVVEGTPVLDSKGNQVIDASGAPVYQSSNGTPLLDANGVQVTDADGVPLWKITTSGNAVDSSVLVVKLTTPYPYGWTSSSVTDLGVLKGDISVVDLLGNMTRQALIDTFDIKDGVAPVILGSTIIRTEDYTGKDTLVIQLSETADLGKQSGTGIFEISTDGGKTWKAVDVLDVSSTGELRIPLEPGAPGTPRPGTLIRIAGNVTDASGNTASSSTSPAVVVKGDPRPDLVKVTGPTALLEITEADGKRVLGGPMAFLATRSGTNDTAAYQPGVGYVDNSAVTSVCPDARLCATTTLYINRASSVQMIVYDQLGTFVAKTSFFVTKKDLELIEKDKLDRARLQIVWNLRDMENRQVSTGVYLVRMLVRFDDDVRPDARMQNYILRYGVKVR